MAFAARTADAVIFIPKKQFQSMAIGGGGIKIVATADAGFELWRRLNRYKF